MNLAIRLNRDELSELSTPVVVEMWDKRLEGRVKRAWVKEFSEKERAKAATLYPLFYRWYLVKGLPEDKIFMPNTLDLVRRLVHFFGTI